MYDMRVYPVSCVRGLKLYPGVCYRAWWGERYGHTHTHTVQGGLLYYPRGCFVECLQFSTLFSHDPCFSVRCNNIISSPLRKEDPNPETTTTTTTSGNTNNLSRKSPFWRTCALPSARRQRLRPAKKTSLPARATNRREEETG